MCYLFLCAPCCHCGDCTGGNLGQVRFFEQHVATMKLSAVYLAMVMTSGESQVDPFEVLAACRIVRIA